MEYVALASDYDGTLACDGFVTAETLHALEKLRQSGRRLILVTGRDLADLQSVFSRLDLFDRVVADNGALIFTPSTLRKQILAKPPKPQFLETLRARGVHPLTYGDVIMATSSSNAAAVLEVIHDLGLELQLIFNKTSVMILPAGVNKKFGLEAALKDLNIDAAAVIGVGDAENDQALLEYCGFSVAVANALPSLKETADFTTPSADGTGVVELIEMLLAGRMPPKRTREPSYTAPA